MLWHYIGLTIALEELARHYASVADQAERSLPDALLLAPITSTVEKS